MNNISEALNSSILGARAKLVLTMCEWIGLYLMNRMATLQYKLGRYEGRIMLHL